MSGKNEMTITFARYGFCFTPKNKSIERLCDHTFCVITQKILQRCSRCSHKVIPQLQLISQFIFHSYFLPSFTNAVHHLCKHDAMIRSNPQCTLLSILNFSLLWLFIIVSILELKISLKGIGMSESFSEATSCVQCSIQIHSSNAKVEINQIKLKSRINLIIFSFC